VAVFVWYSKLGLNYSKWVKLWVDRQNEIKWKPHTSQLKRHLVAIAVLRQNFADVPAGKHSQFTDIHKPLLTIAHELIISSFETAKDSILYKYRTTDQLQELLDDIAELVLRSRKLLGELRVLSGWNICKILPKNGDCHQVAFQLMGTRLPFYLILSINPQLYPFAVIKPKFAIPDEDRHLYCVKLFTTALQKIQPGQFDYIERLLKAAKVFIKSMKKLAREKKLKLVYAMELEAASSQS